MNSPRPDPVTELIAILRDQLQRKDEQIAALQGLLRESYQKQERAAAKGAADDHIAGHLPAGPTIAPAVSAIPAAPPHDRQAQSASVILPSPAISPAPHDDNIGASRQKPPGPPALLAPPSVNVLAAAAPAHDSPAPSTAAIAASGLPHSARHRPALTPEEEDAAIREAALRLVEAEKALPPEPASAREPVIPPVQVMERTSEFSPGELAAARKPRVQLPPRSPGRKPR